MKEVQEKLLPGNWGCPPVSSSSFPPRIGDEGSVEDPIWEMQPMELM